MIAIQRANERHHSDHGWLKSNFSYSFADYYDPNYMNFGPMRVLNDDWIAPQEGFGMHPHRDMEIVTVVLKGHLEHRDSLGNKAATTWGGIQRMSAGSGIHHSEFNVSPDEPLELLQMWFLPTQRGIEPSYETTDFDPAALKGHFVPIASSTGVPGKVAHLHQDMTIYLAEAEAGQTLNFRAADGRKAFLFVLDGDLDVNGSEARLSRRDAARIEETSELALHSAQGALFMLIDLP